MIFSGTPTSVCLTEARFYLQPMNILYNLIFLQAPKQKTQNNRIWEGLEETQLFRFIWNDPAVCTIHALTYIIIIYIEH